MIQIGYGAYVIIFVDINKYNAVVSLHICNNIDVSTIKFPIIHKNVMYNFLVFKIEFILDELQHRKSEICLNFLENTGFQFRILIFLRKSLQILNKILDLRVSINFDKNSKTIEKIFARIVKKLHRNPKNQIIRIYISI